MSLNIEGLKAGIVHALNREYALNNGVRLTTRFWVKKSLQNQQSVFVSVILCFLYMYMLVLLYSVHRYVHVSTCSNVYKLLCLLP